MGEDIINIQSQEEKDAWHWAVIEMKSTERTSNVEKDREWSVQ